MAPTKSKVSSQGLSIEDSKKIRIPLDSLALAYLLLPVFVFILAFLKTIFAAPLALALFGVVVYLTKKFSRPIFVSKKTLLVALATSALWVGMSGVGGMGFQNSDYQKHNALTKALITNDLPLYVEENNIRKPVVYSMAYFITPAVLGKITGWNFSQLYMILAGIFGVFIALVYFQVLIGTNSSLIFMLFPFLGGLDALGYLLQTSSIFTLGDHIEWWNSTVQFSGTTTLLFWVPQHALPAWIGSALVLRAKQTATPVISVLVITAVAYWSVFSAIGIVLLSLPYLLASLKHLKTTMIIPIILAAVVIASYTLASDLKFPIVLTSQFESDFLSSFLLFVFIEFGIFSIICFRPLKLEGEISFFIYINLLLIATFFIKIGFGNDFTMRASCPILFVFWIYVVKSLRKMNRYEVVALSCIVFVGSFAAFSEQKRSLQYSRFGELANLKTVMGITEVPYYRQYLGKENSFFFEILSKDNNK